MGSEEVEFGIGEGPAKPISVSLPAGTIEALRALVGSRGVSAVVASAVEDHLRDRLTELYIKEYTDVHGDFTAEERQKAADIWAEAEKRWVEAEKRAEQWHEAS